MCEVGRSRTCDVFEGKRPHKINGTSFDPDGIVTSGDCGKEPVGRRGLDGISIRNGFRPDAMT